MKLTFHTLTFAAAALCACSGCAAPVQPEFKSPHSLQAPVDCENALLLLKHGQHVLFPYSTPRCPYYDPKANLGTASGPGGQPAAALPPVVHGGPAEQVAPPGAASSGEPPPTAAK